MTRQDYILSIINNMPDWEMGRGIKAMIENNQIDDHTMDVLVEIFKKAVEKMADVIKKYHLMEAIQAIESLNTKKAEQAQQDAQDIEKLNGMLDAAF